MGVAAIIIMKLPKLFYWLIPLQSVCFFLKAYWGDDYLRESPLMWVLAAGILSPMVAASGSFLNINTLDERIRCVMLIGGVVLANMFASSMMGWIFSGNIPQ